MRRCLLCQNDILLKRCCLSVFILYSKQSLADVVAKYWVYIKQRYLLRWFQCVQLLKLNCEFLLFYNKDITCGFFQFFFCTSKTIFFSKLQTLFVVTLYSELWRLRHQEQKQTFVKDQVIVFCNWIFIVPNWLFYCIIL